MRTGEKTYKYYLFRYLPLRLNIIILFGFLFNFFQITVFCQTNRVIDSLYSVLDTTRSENTKIRLLNKISSAYVRSDIKIADSINRICLVLAKKNGDKRLIADATYVLFKIQKKNDQYEQALNSIQIAEQLFLDCNDSLTYADCLLDEGTTLVRREELLKAVSVLVKAERIYLNHKTKDGDLALLYSTLGSINNIQHNNEAAIFYHEKSLNANIEKGFSLGISANYVNLGNVYKSIKDFPKSILYYLKALEIKEKIGDVIGIQKCMNNLGVAYMNQGDFNKAIEFHQKALKYALEMKSGHYIAMSYINLGYANQKAGKFERAIGYCEAAVETIQKENELSLLKEAMGILYESYAAQGNFTKAYEYLLSFKQYSDSVTKANNVKEISEIQTKYETIKKDNEISTLKIDAADQELQLQQTRVYVILFIGLFVIVSVLVVYLFQRSKNAKRIHAKLQEINDLKSAFFANLSHEFRTPLTLMLGPAEILLDKANPSEKPLLQLIHRNASRLLALDEQLLEFTRIDSGSQQLKLAKGNILQLISGIVASFEMASHSKNIALEHDFHSEKVDLLFDPDIIEKVVSNLISNAIKYTPVGGKINVIVSTDVRKTPNTESLNSENKKWLIIEIIDNGFGIPKEKQELIFERYYQLNNYTSGIYDGFGIGLALVKELVKLHKGELVLNSEEGKGSQFSVFLPTDPTVFSHEEIKRSVPYKNIEYQAFESDPIKHQAFTQDDSANAQKDESAIESMHKVLVVDDNQDMRAYLIEILKDNYEVSEASNGSEGLNLAIQQHPDLIVSDIMMEKMDGLEFCRNLKSNAETKHIPVILLTALTATDNKIMGLEFGADDYMEKPFVARELVVRIKSLIVQRKFLKDLFTKELRLEPRSISISSSDAVFLQKLINTIENNIENIDLDVEFLAKSVFLSRSQLHRRITALTDQSASNFIRIIRIKRAAQMMELRSGNISEIMYNVGFNSLSYFSKSFREIYKMTPSEFMADHHHEITD